MKPIAIFRHAATEGPGYFATFLGGHSRSWKEIKIDRGEAVPREPGDFAGLVFMGGPMSVNDPLPWVAAELELIRRAIEADIPVLGHCLGGQLIAKAMGAAVTGNPVKEIGWGPVEVLDDAEAARWFGDRREFLAFHWHGETFAVPPGFSRVLASPWCPNQAYVRGKHMGMQCHVEMTEEMIRAWCAGGAEEIARSDGPAVQSAAAIMTDMAPRVQALNAVADRIYSRWIEGLTG